MTVSRYTGRGGVTRWRYSIKYQAGGKWHHVERRGFETKREATDAEHAARQDLRAVSGSMVGNGTVGDYLRWWFQRYEASGSRKQSTVANTRKHVFLHLIPHLEDVKLRRVTLDVVQDLANTLHRSGKKDGTGLDAKTVSNVIGTLRKALGDAVRSRKLPYNPAIGVDLPRRKKYEGKAYDATEIDVLLTHLRRDPNPEVSVVDYAIVRLLFATGLRRGEVLGLRWHDVDLLGRRLTVRTTRIVVDGRIVETDPKSIAGRRTVTFDGDTRDALARLRNALDDAYAVAGLTMGDDAYVATRLDGQPVHPLTITRRFQRHAIAAGLTPIRLHDPRGSHVQAALAGGIDPVTVSHRVGHSRTSTTLDLYGRLMPSHDQEAADLIGSLLNEANLRAQTSSELRPGMVGNEVTRRTTSSVEPAENKGETTRDDATMEATPGIERQRKASDNP